MKKFFFLLLIIVSTITISAQTKKYYCEIKGIEKALDAGLKIVFDFGANPVYTVWGGLNSNQSFVNEFGMIISFNSMVDAGNFMADKGWTFVQAYTSLYGSQTIIHWIFYKEAESPEEAMKGIMTKEEYDKQNKN